MPTDNPGSSVPNSMNDMGNHAPADSSNLLTSTFEDAARQSNAQSGSADDRNVSGEFRQVAFEAPEEPETTGTVGFSPTDSSRNDSNRSLASNFHAQVTTATQSSVRTPTEEGETLASLRAHLGQLEKQRATPQLKLEYTMDGPTETRVHKDVDADNEAAVKLTQAKIQALEKEERRRDYMKQQQTNDPEEGQEDPDPVAA